MLYDIAVKYYYYLTYLRSEKRGPMFYFTHKDFPGLKHKPYPFKSSRGHNLSGFFYEYDNPIPGRIIIFEHGMGTGHRAYMREIEILARHGYRVFSYDHTGCEESGGEDTGGLTQSLMDLNDALNTLKSDPEYQNEAFSVIGHSWGGFSTLNINIFHPDVRHQISFSAFRSFKAMLQSNSFLGMWRRLYRSEMKRDLFRPETHAVDSLKQTKAQVLIVHSKDDKVVDYGDHFKYMKKALEDYPNIRFLTQKNKGHNPNYTEDAVQYKKDFFKIVRKLMKTGRTPTQEELNDFFAQHDFWRMTAQDEDVWREVFAVLDNTEN